MKIEASKNHASEQRKESKNVYRSDSTVFDRAGSSKTAASIPAPGGGAFAKILEETRREKNDSSNDKTHSADADAQSPKTEGDEKTLRVQDERSEEKNSHGGGSGDTDAGNSNQNPAPPAPPVLNSPKISQDNAAAARAILHISDLERIISTIRSQTFQNQKQILIALKNSVLHGLQIRLTVTENGKIKAEFLALDEQVKRQLKRRKNELAEILKNRSALFSAIEITTPNAAEKE